MAITPLVCRYIRPKSVDDSYYENFEYLMAWFGRDGSFCQKLFTDYEEADRIRTKPINIDDGDYISTIITDKRKTITLTAEDLSYSDYRAMLSLAEATQIIRVFTDGTYEKMAIEPTSSKITRSDLRYNISFELAPIQKPIPR